MKHLICWVFATLFASSAFAQPTISSGSPSLDITVKRAFAQGEDVCVDLIITCRTDWEWINIYHCRVFDDEGNCYDSNDKRIDVLVDEKTFDLCNYRAIVYLAKDIPRKARIIIKKVDDFATTLSQINISWKYNNNCMAVVKNIPITKE